MRRVLLLAVLLPLTACPPPCRQVCRKVLFDCELDTERVALEECELACETQDALYELWEDERLQKLFDDHRRCVGRSSCEELADGACYEGFEDLFVFDPDKDAPAPATLTLSGEVPDVGDGTPVVAALIPPQGDRLPAEATTASESFELVFSDALAAGRTYTVDYYLDLDRDAACDAAEAARVTVFQDVGEGDRVVTTTLASDANPEACATFQP